MIEISNLSKSYSTPKGIFEALQDINLHVKEGEIFGIIGPSGAGKSTLVKCINLLERADRGTIHIGGQLLSDLSESALREQRRRIGMVFQGFNLLARRTVYGNVALPLEIAGVPAADIQARVMRLLKLVNLTHLADRFPNQISGGQKQRVGIARALAVKPDMLVCDEAVAALDVSIQAQILNLFMDLREQLNLTYLFISHDLGVVKHVADRVVIMYLGRIVEMADTEEVFSHPNHPYTQILLDEIPHLTDRRKLFTSIKGEIPSPLNPPTGCHFHPRCPKAMPRCTTEVPKLKNIAVRHISACHLNDHA